MHLRYAGESLREKAGRDQTGGTREKSMTRSGCSKSWTLMKRIIWRREAQRGENVRKIRTGKV